MLMDMFAEALGEADLPVIRVHFHKFMLAVHAKLHAFHQARLTSPTAHQSRQSFSPLMMFASIQREHDPALPHAADILCPLPPNCHTPTTTFSSPYKSDATQ